MRRFACVLPSLLVIVTWCADSESATSATEIVRGIYCHPGPAVDNRLWGGFGKGYQVDAEERHSGRSSIRCTNTDGEEAHGAGQQVSFNQDKRRPLVVAGWAKLAGVTGPASYRCSVYLDLRLKNGESWPMKIACFDPSKQGWQYSEKIYQPPAPIASARAYVFLRQSKGTAWFDDIYVGEVVDDQGTRSKNLLEDPGLEMGSQGDTKLRDEFFGKLQEIGCNAFHFYKGVPWSTLMADDALPAIDPKDTVLDFVRDAHRRGFKVWLTVGAPGPPIENTQSPEFPFYACVNGRWGQVYTKAVAYFTQYGVDGIGVVPDEWTYTNGRVKRRFAKHKDPAVAEFYQKMPSYCDCPVCQSMFRERYGLPYPDMAKPWATADPVWPRLVEFRYDATSAWMQRTVEAAKRINPKVVTDTMICVLPVCSDDRIAAGAAWDKIGVDTQLDCLQTDPYLFLHNYRGDSTHYYATETAIHLTEANWARRSGVTIEACRLRDHYRQKDPAEVYGAALSCLAHGATEFFWWHMNYLLGRTKHVEPEPPSRRVAAFYQVVKDMEPFVLNAAPAGDVLVLYSRASEDTWDRLGKHKLLPAAYGEQPDAKRGFIAHKHLLYWLLRRGYPFRTTFLDNPDPAKLARARVVLVPFPLSLKESEVAAIERIAQQGKTVVVMSELSPLDELGQTLPRPRLSRLFADAQPGRGDAGPVAAAVGKGKLMFLGDDFAVGLFESVEPMKDPQGSVPLPAFDAGRTAALEKAIADALGRPGSALAAQPELDVEVAVLDGPKGRLVLAINWDTDKPAEVELRPQVTRGRRMVGWTITADAVARRVERPLAGGVCRVKLQPQEATLVRLD